MYQIGITREEKYKKFNDQGNVCAACGSTEHKSFRNLGESGWCADHDHVTKKFRGVLCNPCNLALGYVQDSPDRLMSLIAYLERSK